MKKLLIASIILVHLLSCSQPTPITNNKKTITGIENSPALIDPVVEHFYTAFNTGDTTAFLTIAATKFLDKMFDVPPTDGGKSNMVFVMQSFHNAFPDLHIALDKYWKAGNTVICKTTITGTNKNDFFGLPATNKKVAFSAIDIFELQNDKISNVWHVEEIEKLKDQLKN